MLTLTPVQLILLVLALEVISAPIIIFCMTSAILTWWNKRQEFEIERENRILHIVNNGIDSFLNGVKETTLTKNKDVTSNEH